MPMERVNQQKVVNNTNYKDEFPKKETSLEKKAYHSDNLKTGGPMIGLTTYSSNYFAKQSPTVPFVIVSADSGACRQRNLLGWVSVLRNHQLSERLQGSSSPTSKGCQSRKGPEKQLTEIYREDELSKRLPNPKT